MSQIVLGGPGEHGGVLEPRLRAIGPSGVRVLPVALGGTKFGWISDGHEANDILDTFTEHGGNFVDTADSYAGGRSEIIIGNWMRDRRNRADVVVATKIGKSADNPGLSSRAVHRAVEASLVRLRTSYIDLLFLHLDDPTVPFEETLLAVDELIQAGKVRYFGASHHTPERLMEARIAAGQLGVANLVALQNQYNLMQREEYENGLAKIAEYQNLGVMPRFGLAGGFLSGRYRSKADLASSTHGAKLSGYLGRRGFRILAALEAIAAQHGCAPASIALAWLLSKPNVVAPVVSVSSAGQVVDLIAAASIQLSRAQATELDRVSAR
jgi:aryl-alcohol dehydrogenase-like predicted oxidoreductase